MATGDSDATAADLAVLRDVLNAWDPYCLIRQGAPQDEFDPERADIYEALTSGRCDSEEALTAEIVAIFTRWFGPGFDRQNCSEFAHQVWIRWQDRVCT